MLDSAVCAGMTFGAVRHVSALAELHQLLTERGFRQSSLGDPTIVQEQQYVEPTDAGPVIGAPAQHFVRFGKAFAGWTRPSAAPCSSDWPASYWKRPASRPQSVMMTSRSFEWPWAPRLSAEMP